MTLVKVCEITIECVMIIDEHTLKDEGIMHTWGVDLDS